jgi:D-alanine-D-alanine ligase
MKISVLYTPAPANAPPDDRDGEVQRDFVSGVLRELGHTVSHVPFTLDLPRVVERLEALRPACVLNLVESVAGLDRLIHLAPSVLDAMGMPYTGAPLAAMLLTTNKVVAKRVLHAQGLPTPEWWERGGRAMGRPAGGAGAVRAIVKPVWNHGSVGIDDRSVFDGEDMDAWVGLIEAREGEEVFAERFIEGREFNLSLLASDKGVRVLPPAEMTFRGYPRGKPAIVGYEAKWAAGSFEETHTVRRFDLPPTDAGLASRLGDIAERCWSLFGMRGYARVDFRVDGDGRPYVLEVNANPCLAPDAGFLAAADQAGLRPGDAVAAIVEDAVRTAPGQARPLPAREPVTCFA